MVPVRRRAEILQQCISNERSEGGSYYLSLGTNVVMLEGTIVASAIKESRTMIVVELLIDDTG